MKTTNRNTNKLVLFKKLLIIICAVVIGCVIGWSLNNTELKDEVKDDSNEILRIKYGETLPVSESDDTDHSEEDSYDYKVYLLIDPYCDSCISNVDVANRLAEILTKAPIGIYVLWRQMPSDEKMNALTISKEKQVVLPGKEISNEYPSYILTDSSEKVIMITDDEEKLIRKLKELEGDAELQRFSNSYLLKTASIQDKKRLVYFAMDGCPDCERIMENSKVVEAMNNYDTVTVYTSSSYGEQEFADVGNILRSIYDIRWYPSFLIIDKDGTIHIIGEEPDDAVIDDLMTYSE